MQDFVQPVSQRLNLVNYSFITRGVTLYNVSYNFLKLSRNFRKKHIEDPWRCIFSG